ncbi:MAG: GGDEF domain-containing protein [Burkholderiaceae bacterium]
MTSLLIVVMPIAILIVGTRSASIWSVIVVSGLLVVAGLDVTNMLPATTETVAERRSIQVATMIACIIGSAFTAGYFTRQADQSMLALDEERHRHEHRANHDHLTSLPNRAQFERQGHLMLEQCKETGSTCTLVFMDINGFKPVNDTYGHAVGDELLVAFAGRVNACVDKEDLFARLAGDEFVLLAHGAEGEFLAERLTQRLQTAVAKPFVLTDQPITVGISIGAANYPEDGRDIHSLLMISDQRMYDNKQSSGERRRDLLLV